MERGGEGREERKRGREEEGRRREEEVKGGKGREERQEVEEEDDDDVWGREVEGVAAGPTERERVKREGGEQMKGGEKRELICM